MKELIKNRRFLTENKKDKFITDHLFSYLIRHIEESEDSSKTTDLVAAMYIFPYRTRDGINIGSLKEPGIPWYYDKEDGNKEYSSDNYRIFADEVLQADQAEKIRQLFSTKRYINEFTKAVVIDDLITRMGKETDYTEAWWKYALDFLKLWQKDKFALNVAKATENIDNNYFLFLDDYCDQSLKERLIRFGIFRDIMTPIAKEVFWNKITDAQERYRALNVLKSLGVPHTFSVKKEGFWTGVSFRQEEMINKHILQFALEIAQNVSFPVAPGDINYQKCDLCHDLFMRKIYEESKNDNIYANVLSAFETVVMQEDDEHKEGIPVKNVKGEYIPLSWDLFYSKIDFGDMDWSSEENTSDVIDIETTSSFEYESLHIDVNEYERAFIEKCSEIHEFSSVCGAFNDYGIDEEHAVGFYRWLWNYSHHEELVDNILTFFSDVRRNKCLISEKNNKFILSVLENVNTDEEVVNTRYTFNMLVNLDDAFSNAEVLNKVNRFFKEITVNISGKFERIDVTSYVEELLNKAQASYSVKSQIQNDEIWNSVYGALGEGIEYNGVYVLGNYLNNGGTRSLLTQLSEDTESYITAIGKYIQEEYGNTIRLVGSYGKDTYVNLVRGIYDFISEKMDLKSLDNLPFSTASAKMDDIANFGEEKRIWNFLRKQRDQIIKEESGYGGVFGKKFLDSKYHGRCQLCGGKTITGEQNSRFFTYRIVKPGQNSLADMPSNLLCLCPSCWGKLEAGAFMGKDMSEIILKSKKYVDYIDKMIDNTAFEDDFPCLISELEEDQNLTIEEEEELEGFHKPIVCRVIVNGEKRCMAFSWEHFIRLAFILSEYENNELVKDTEYPRMSTF